MNGSFYQNPTFPGNNYQTPQTPPGNISINDVSNTSIPLTMELQLGLERLDFKIWETLAFSIPVYNV